MFDWKENYSLGIEEIDNQHKHLLEIGTELYDLMASKERRQSDKYDEIMETIHKLKDYTVFHFDFEEGLMQKCNYSDVDNHEKEHRTFVDKISEIEDEDIDSFQNKITMELIGFVASWIEKHILETDRKYVAELNACL